MAKLKCGQGPQNIRSLENVKDEVLKQWVRAIGDIRFSSPPLQDEIDWEKSITSMCVFVLVCVCVCVCGHVYVVYGGHKFV